MNEPPIEAEVVPASQAIAIRQTPGAVGILRPADTLDAIADAFKEYQRVCERILTKDDYQEYEGKPRKKKSAWRKLATAFNVSTEIMSTQVLRPDGRHVVMAEIRVRASTPGGRQSEALGSCDVNEKCCANARGQKCHKAAWKGHYCCQDGCDGRKHWSHPDHDIISTAQTRATNRAIADLIGCGEVSAEEIIDSPAPAPKAPQTPAPVKPPTPAPKAPPAPSSAQPQPTNGPHYRPATAQTRLWMLKELQGSEKLALDYFQKLEWLLPQKEGLADLPLRFVPNTRAKMKDLKERLAEFGNGEMISKPYEPDWNAEGGPPPKTPANTLPKPGDPNPEAWRYALVPIPRKGQKRADYLKNPDSLGSLYDKRHGNDEESQYCRQRLWGLIHHYEPKPFTKRDGTVIPPSQDELDFVKQLEAFKAYWEANHRGEKL